MDLRQLLIEEQQDDLDEQQQCEDHAAHVVVQAAPSEKCEEQAAPSEPRGGKRKDYGRKMIDEFEPL